MSRCAWTPAQIIFLDSSVISLIVSAHNTQIAATSSSAREHGVVRRKQRYTFSNADRGVANPASEPLYHPEPQSRRTRFTRVLLDVITIADEGGFSVETGNAFASWNLRRHSALRLNVAGYSESRNRLADVSL